MKKFILTASLLASMSSMAASVSFTYFGNQGGNQTFYACSYVEDQAEMFLNELGATNINVRCTGGIIGNWNAQPVSLRASFDLPEITGESESELEITGDSFSPSCGINVRMLQEFFKVMPHVTVLKKNDACAFHNSNFFYKLKLSH